MPFLSVKFFLSLLHDGGVLALRCMLYRLVNMTAGSKEYNGKLLLLMSLQMNGTSTQNQESVQYAPPKYEEIIGLPMWNINTVPPTGHPLDEHAQPPSYDSIPELPIWTIPLPVVNSSFSTQQWNEESFIDPYNEMFPAEYQIPNAVQTSDKSLFIYKCWKSPPAILGYLITGCLLITAHIKPFVCQVGISLCFNIITGVVSSVGLMFNAKDLQTLWDKAPYYDEDQLQSGLNIHYALIGTNVALLCFSVSAGIFELYVLYHSTRKNPQDSEIENNFTPTDLPETTLPSPPPYTSQRVHISRTTQ
ncbi:uncharacterized protein [Dendropsophus ebraccatus]|uniref:uncharacterized protein isoform X2 n=1 Tax=Dendropsophus ebraccatus TaxID=150705 RepID=UPI00383152A5